MGDFIEVIVPAYETFKKVWYTTELAAQAKGEPTKLDKEHEAIERYNDAWTNASTTGSGDPYYWLKAENFNKTIQMENKWKNTKAKKRKSRY